MIPATCKRLIEVDFPIARVSEHSAREKSIRHGHPSTLHLWWARRPLAACRAVLLGLLLPDPCDGECPPDFKVKARELLAKRFTKSPKTDDALRKLLLEFIGEFADWDHAANALYLEIGRGLVRAAHLPAAPSDGAAQAGPDETPVVVDPFAGGGSIPLEALRLSCEAFASDLNPVACLILKTLLEDIPRYGDAEFKLPGKDGKKVVVHGLADALRHVGKQVKEAAERELDEFYPLDSDGSRPIAYLWARTVRCEGIGCGAEIPLVRSFWLCKKPTRRRALRYRVERSKGKRPHVEFEVFDPKTDSDLQNGTVTRANAACPCCHTVLPAERVRSQLAAEHGGGDVAFDESGKRTGGATLLAVVTLRNDSEGRYYRVATKRDYDVVFAAQMALAKAHSASIPNEPLPPVGTLGFRVQRYGMLRWRHLFTKRQSLTLATLAAQIAKQEVSDGVKALLALVLSGVEDRNVSLATWRPQADQEKVEHLFARQALPMAWDFGEAVPLSQSTGSFDDRVSVVADCVESLLRFLTAEAGQLQQTDARKSPLPDSSVSVWFTDPPYYDAVPYSDLSDFFFVWLKRVLPGHPLLRDPYDGTNPLTPKLAELVQDETKKFDGQPKDKAFFEAGVAEVFHEGRRVLRDGGVGCVVFAHKSTEGWEALLTGMISGGWTISASWPITTELGSRLRARDSAALAGSVHLVCRPRRADAGVGDWSEVKTAMETRIRQWLPTLLKHGVRGADAIFSCLGPALESYSRYDKVLTAADQEVPLGGDPDATEPEKRGFLAYVFEALSKETLRQVLGDLPAAPACAGHADRPGGSVAQAGAETEGFEEDARMTALFLWTLQATQGKAEGSRLKAEGENAEADSCDSSEDEDEGKPTKAKAGFTMPFDTFIRITRPMGIHYPVLEHRVIEIEKGVVRLLPVRHRSEQVLGDLPAEWQAGAATRPGVQISLADVQQMELGLLVKRQEDATSLATPKKGKKAAPGTSAFSLQPSALSLFHPRPDTPRHAAVQPGPEHAAPAGAGEGNAPEQALRAVGAGLERAVPRRQRRAPDARRRPGGHAGSAVNLQQRFESSGQHG